jgi:hypothetical protein
MTTILIIFLTKYFQTKITDQVIKIFPSTKGFKVGHFFKFSFSSMKEMDKNK